ncbi:MAG TPA: rod shape-determining protein RodA [Acidimicrobiia bacterium]|jgi:rod shape determining protein RodA|nr:rod shape-determining protein RodA [Acidimicrobiia bacterium]
MTAVLNRIRELGVVRRNNRTDWMLLGTALALSGFGLLMIYSATRNTGTFSMERQMIFVAAGLLLFLITSNIDYREYRGIIPAASIVMLVLLIAVFFFPKIENVNRWIPLGFFNLQPAEFAKVVVIVALASLLAPPASRDELTTPRTLTWTKMLQAIVLVAVPGYLILREPDLGTSLVFGFILFVMLFLAGASWRQLAVLTTLVAIGVIAVVQLHLLSDYQMNRIEVLFNPEIDPQGIGYQLQQSKNAIGSGQLFGTGLFADDSLTAFQYVPEQETDFIFTAVAEQLGLLGGLLVIVAFVIIVWRLLVIASNARDRFGALIAAGIAAMIVFHAFINIGMTIGIMPVTGIPLPFLSQGGSFYMAMSLALGIANSIWLMRTPVPGENQLT